jgi:hypothetical protein
MDYITVFPWKFLKRAIGSVENSWAEIQTPTISNKVGEQSLVVR